ncbi:hypothetical protein RJ640_002439 [Escallonia rubra]|uniref:Pentatricopeptide repeat-containing protein n=1 Tax=Escallonia rubra TaxID=112253 RepID=A0AA88UWV8_9ASTE|nr:hypothetical protein RJ640_002439 [Escallonia rubra]
MRREGIAPDGASFSTPLPAADTIAALDQGTLIHGQMIRIGFGRNPGIASSLITMYAKCGGLIDARRAFDETEDMNVVSWTAMISAFQHHGCADQAVEFFEVMLEEGRMSDAKSFVESMPNEPDASILGALLGACRSWGILNWAEKSREAFRN